MLMNTRVDFREKCPTTIAGNHADDTLLRRVRGEFSEMPGMRLTVDQAMRLWALDRPTCDDVLTSLMAAHFLERDLNGRYRRADGGY
jgi:hypothetical protein